MLLLNGHLLLILYILIIALGVLLLILCNSLASSRIFWPCDVNAGAQLLIATLSLMLWLWHAQTLVWAIKFVLCMTPSLSQFHTLSGQQIIILIRLALTSWNLFLLIWTLRFKIAHSWLYHTSARTIITRHRIIIILICKYGILGT